MQNRYVGDVGDFAKYALLRRLAGTSCDEPIWIGIIWCRHPDENHNSDGRHVSYLQGPEFAKLDTELITALRKIVELRRRSISAVVEAAILPQQTIYYDALACLPQGVPATPDDRLFYRARWLEDCLNVTRGTQLIFFDPDNGIEVPSVPKHAQKAGKYIFWDELVTFWGRGQNLLIYHHLNRTKSAADQIAQMTDRIRLKFECPMIKPLVFRRGSCRVFWLICHHTALGYELNRRATDLLSSDWGAHFRPFE